VFLGQTLAHGHFQFRGDLLDRRGEADLLAEANRQRVGVNVEARGAGHGTFSAPLLLRQAGPARQRLPGVSCFVHHSIVESHDKNTSILRAHASHGAEFVKQRANVSGGANVTQN
jgi:hypothetical protein